MRGSGTRPSLAHEGETPVSLPGDGAKLRTFRKPGLGCFALRYWGWNQGLCVLGMRSTAELRPLCGSVETGLFFEGMPV